MIDLLVVTILVLQIGLIIYLVLAKSKKTSVGGDRLEKVFKDELSRSRKEASDSGKSSREELSKSIQQFSDSLDKRLLTMGTQVEKRLDRIRDDNTKQLDKMRETVDEKLQTTLEKRLGESFKQVSVRLEQVHKGLGEMQELASGVGDLKKVLTNVKTRGTWGEIQLDSLLEQILTKDQYGKNVMVKKGSKERVDFAIKIPSKDDDNRDILLPIDAKYPLEDYRRLIKATESGDREAYKSALKGLETRIKEEAKRIRAKYIDPPRTTDFAILYLPVEGLYAEVTQQVKLVEELQRKYRVAVSGPNTIAALLNSLQMGFRTLAIQQRTSEVWEVLGAVKTEFGRFGDLLDKTKKKLDEASNTIDNASAKSRNLERKLGKVEKLARPKNDVDVLPDEID